MAQLIGIDDFDEKIGVCSVAITYSCANTLRHAELQKVLSQCELYCGSFKKLKRIVYTNTEAIQKDANRLFDLAAEDMDAEEAKRLLGAISERLNLIHSVCKKYQRTENSLVLRALRKIIQKTNALMGAESLVVLKSQGKRSLATN